MIARVPEVLAAYQCQRSMACCQIPWKATLRPEELRDLQLARGPAAELLRSAVHTRLGTPMLAQPQGVCTLLDVEGRACRVHQLGGLAALLVGCRLFPRSVVDTPEGCEIGFSLCCPTAASMVVDRPIPFVWADLTQPLPHEGYPPSRKVGDRLPASRSADWSMAEVRAWRQGWWQRLADPQQPLMQWLADALRTPLDPQVAGVGQDLAHRPELGALLTPWTQAQVHPVTEGLGRLRDTGPEHRAVMRTHWQAWLAPADLSVVQRAALRHRALASCCAGLWLQHAAVHDGAALGESLTKTAKQVGQLLRLLVEFEAQGGSKWQRDAVIAASHWGRG